MTGDGVHRVDNGLEAPTYVPLTDVDAEIGVHLLTALGRARIAAYLDIRPGSLRRLFVAADERADARTIVAAAVRALGSPEPPPVTADPLDGVDTDAEFAALIADWHVDTVNAIREAERELNREDAEWRERLAEPTAPSDEPVWLDDEHYVPPPPPPLPRFAAPTIMGLTILAVSIIVLGLGGEIGLANDLTWILGVGGVLLGAGILVSRLREHRDEDDDGSAV
jgi:hypothetical protein